MGSDSKRAKVEAQVLDLVRRKKFRKAALQVAAYEAKQQASRGLGIDWKNYDPENDLYQLEVMFSQTPNILKGVSDEDMDHLRVAAANLHLWGTNNAAKWLPDSVGTNLTLDREAAVRMLVYFAKHQLDIQGYRETGFITHVEVLDTDTSCAACQSIAGKKYQLDEIPELPFEHCTHEMGCRCTLLSVI